MIVVDGGSVDDTVAIAREYDATVIEGSDSSIAAGRNRGAEYASGQWFAFVDADTRVRPDYLPTMLEFVEANDLTVASARCRVTGPSRAKLVELTINHVFPRLERPVLPGFNFFVHHRTFDRFDGFPTVPNEDTALSRELGATVSTEYCPEVLVETSGRRIAEQGLTGTLWYYTRLDAQRVRAEY